VGSVPQDIVARNGRQAVHPRLRDRNVPADRQGRRQDGRHAKAEAMHRDHIFVAREKYVQHHTSDTTMTFNVTLLQYGLAVANAIFPSVVYISSRQ
jgi:hypothetical protein